jgi:hypothetical protein
MSLSLPLTVINLSHTPTCHINLSNMSLINMSNLSLSLILNQILSHGSYTKDTSQLDVQHHQHMPLPSMYQYHQHTITRYVSQPCTKPSTCTIPSINHVPQPIPKQVHQPCTNTYTKPCINHAPYPNCASTMHQVNHVSTCIQPSTMYINTIPCINHVPYHVPTMHINHNKCLNHIPYHSQSCHVP